MFGFSGRDIFLIVMPGRIAFSGFLSLFMLTLDQMSITGLYYFVANCIKMLQFQNFPEKSTLPIICNGEIF
jgi:hypothetical protein